MTSYLVTIATDHHGTCLKMCARDERTATASGADVLSSGKKKKIKKSVGMWGGGGGGGGRGGNQPSLGARFLFHSVWWCFPLFEF